jgi:hypothetical protein
MRPEPLLALALVLAPSLGMAQSSACSQIRDQDTRALCRAQTSGRSSDCSTIVNQDSRAFCRGTVTGNRADCSIIRDPDARALCRARTQ